MTDPVLEAQWKAVLDDWESDAAHGSFLQYCEKSDQLLEAAVRYRGMAGDRHRGASAEKKLAAISLLAIAKLESSKTPPRRSLPNVARLIIAIFFAASVLALAFAWHRL